jgi:Domain of unknown function (DUF4276)
MTVKEKGSHRYPKIGIITEGDSEVRALGLLYDQLHKSGCIQLMKPLRASVDPKAPIPVIVKGMSERVRLAIANGASSVVVLLDFEDLQTCAIKRAREMEALFQKAYPYKVFVVIKMRKFENWLIAAPSALECQPARFPGAALVRAASCPNKADSVADAEETLKRATSRRSYDKIRDSARIIQRADIGEMAANSRSFRRFLAVLNHPSYIEGSARP